MISKNVVAKYIRGRRCIFCDSTQLYKLPNKHIKCKKCRRKYSLRKLNKDLNILYHFYLEISARKTAIALGLSYRTVSSRFMYYRHKMAEYLREQFNKLGGEVEIDESYFGGKRKGKRGRGAYNKAIVFGILERNGRVYTAVVPNVRAKTLLRHIRDKTKKGSVYYTDTFRSYNSLVIYGKHERIDHSKTLVEYNKHINGIEGFWSFAKERFMKYHGINRDNYYWYLKEMEFRFNYKKYDLFKLLVQVIYGGIGPKSD
jgi:transposase